MAKFDEYATDQQAPIDIVQTVSADRPVQLDSECEAEALLDAALAIAYDRVVSCAAAGMSSMRRQRMASHDQRRFVNSRFDFRYLMLFVVEPVYLA